MVTGNRKRILLVLTLLVALAVQPLGHCLNGASADSPESLYRKAEMLEYGFSGPADGREAFAVYKMAADAGYVPAKLKVGLLYLEGKGVTRDLPSAVKWFMTAAEQGNADAAYYLGRCYETGAGIPADREAAKRQYGRAAAQGHKLAADALAQLAGLPPDPALNNEPPAVRTVRIGGNLELTGSIGPIAESVNKGIRLYLARNQGMVELKGQRYKLEFTVQDNQSQPEEAAAVMNRLTGRDQGGAVAVLGPLQADNVVAAAKAAEKAGVPLLTPTATRLRVVTDEEQGRVRPYSFPLCLVDPDQGKIMAEFAAIRWPHKKAAVLFDESSKVSVSIKNSFIAHYKAKSAFQPPEFAYNPGKPADYGAVLQRIKQADPDVIFLPGYLPAVGQLIKLARQTGIAVPLLGTDTWHSPALREQAGDNNLNGTYFFTHFISDFAGGPVKQFKDEYEKAYGLRPDMWAVLGYDAAHALVAAIEKAGSDDPEKIRRALETTQDLQLLSGRLTIDPQTHFPKKSAFIAEMVNGEMTPGIIIEYPAN